MYQLRELQREDLKIINSWRNDKELKSFLGVPFRYIDRDVVGENQYEACFFNRGNMIRCSIIEREKNQILGFISLTSIDYINQSAELHIVIGEENQGKGIGTFAVTEMLKHAFCNMNLRRIEWGVLETNEREKRLCEKCGFMLEGRKKKSVYKNGKFIDFLIYAILKENYFLNFRGNSGIYFSTWCIGKTENYAEIKSIINICDEAFGEDSFVCKKEYLDITRKIHQKGHFIFAYEKDVIGYCAFYANDNVSKNAFITLLAVKSNFQNNHIGMALLNYALEMAKEYQMLTCTLEVRKSNISAIHFYEKNRFQICEELEKSYYMKKIL